MKYKHCFSFCTLWWGIFYFDEAILLELWFLKAGCMGKRFSSKFFFTPYAISPSIHVYLNGTPLDIHWERRIFADWHFIFICWSGCPFLWGFTMWTFLLFFFYTKCSLHFCLQNIHFQLCFNMSVLISSYQSRIFIFKILLCLYHSPRIWKCPSLTELVCLIIVLF